MLTSTRSRRLAALALTTPVLVIAAGSPASAETEVERPDSFTSAFTVMATPDTIVDPEGEPVDGEEGATGTFSFMINSDEDIICYEIELDGVTGEYESPAKTATHIHESAAGEAGPPRLAFPDPEGDGDVRTSSSCLQGPFTTGLEGDDGTDTGEGFELSQIEADPEGFAADTHTADFAAGAVRGQLQEMPVDGVDTGQGRMAQSSQSAAQSSTSTGTVAGLGLTGLVIVGAAGVAMRRRAQV